MLMLPDNPVTRAEALQEILSLVRTAVPGRHDALFTGFLPTGYCMTSLSSIAPEHFERALLAKVRIGTLITVYDDFADNPRLRDPALLRDLYALPFRGQPREPAHPVARMAARLWDEVLEAIEVLPHHALLRKAFEFDVEQFYNANRYAELIGDEPLLSNAAENRAYLSHNMGIVLVGTVDLMASPGLVPSELGRIRALLRKAQEIARITNVLATLNREIREGDQTGELFGALREEGGIDLERLPAHALALKEERSRLFAELAARAPSVSTFDAVAYLQGLKGLAALHQSMREVI